MIIKDINLDCNIEKEKLHEIYNKEMKIIYEKFKEIK